VTIGRPTHPGIESAYVLEGGFELPIQGQPARTIKPGEGVQIPQETPHAGASPAIPRPDFLLPTLSRRESHWLTLEQLPNCLKKL
jgi:quercetin dioxygenase-like cupin family protein